MTDGDPIGRAGSEGNAVHLLKSDIFEEVTRAILILYGIALIHKPKITDPRPERVEWDF